MTAALPNIDTLLRHQDWVRALARTLVADPSRADDVAQQTMLEAIERPPKDLSRPKGWLATVARNTARALARQDRRRKHREQLVARSDEVSADPADYMHRAAAHKRVVDALFELEEPYHSVLLLRYFEDFDAPKIAAKLNRPVATVRTQLQRGVERMRQRLDRDYGDRKAWCTALAPLLGQKQAVVGVSILGSLGALAMWKWTVSAIVVIASLFFGMRAIDSFGDPALPATSSNVAEVAVAPAPVAPQPKREEVAEAATVPDVLPVAEQPAVLARGRVLSLDGQALPGVTVAYQGAGLPRLQGDTLVLNSMRYTVKPELRAQLRASDEAMEDFVASWTPYEDRVEALLRGEQVPPLRDVTDGNGGFTLVGISELKAADLAIGDPTWLVYGSGWAADEEDQLFLAGPGVRVSGRVVDEAGEGVVAGVNFQCASDRLPGYAQTLTRHGGTLQRQCVSNAEGFFDLGIVPRLSGMNISAAHRELQSATVASVDVDGPVRLVLEDRKRSDPNGLQGVVCHADGSPAAQAEVIFGQARGTADQQGRFALHVRPVDFRADTSFVAYAVGEIAAIEVAFGARYHAGHREPVTLRLGGKALTISGRIVDAAGVGQPRVHVLLANGTQDGIGIYSIESRIGNRRHGQRVMTDAAGRFTLTGLMRRDYVVRAINYRTLLVLESEPVAAGTSDFVLAASAEPFLEFLEGVLVDRNGDAIRGAKIGIGTTVQSSPSGSQTSYRPGNVHSDAEGRFTLKNCPRANVFLRASGDGVVSQQFDIDDQAELRLVGVRKMRFRIRSYAGGAANRFALHDAEGNQLFFNQKRVSVNSTAFNFEIPSQDSPVFEVREDAVTLIMMRGSKTVTQLPLRLRAGVLNEIDL